VATGDLHKKFREDSPAVPEICLQTDTHTQTDRQTHRPTN